MPQRRFGLVMLLFAGSAYAAERAQISVPGGTLEGTLELPERSNSCPVALILAGSGPTDRDGNNPLLGGENNCLKYLAESLAARGIASLRYDKRGVGRSAQAMTREEDLRFETYIEDAVAWGTELRKNARFTHLVVMGHSEGALIGAVACQKLGGDAFVSIAGPGVPASEILLRQLRTKLPRNLLAEAQSIMARLNQGETVRDVPPALGSLFRTAVQPYLISWFRYDPAREIGRLQVPVLIAQGSTDVQVGVDDARALARANPRARLVVIEGMNHVLKKVSGDLPEQVASYGDPRLPIAPELVEEVVAFVRTLDAN